MGVLGIALCPQKLDVRVVLLKVILIFMEVPVIKPALWGTLKIRLTTNVRFVIRIAGINIKKTTIYFFKKDPVMEGMQINVLLALIQKY